MSEKERTILENLGKVLPNLPESKKEYLIGLGDGIAMAREEKKSTLNDMRAEHGLEPLPDGNVALAKA